VIFIFIYSLGPRKYLGSHHKSGWMNVLKRHKDDYKAQVNDVFTSGRINLGRVQVNDENKRKANFQNFYKKVSKFYFFKSLVQITLR